MATFVTTFALPIVPRVLAALVAPALVRFAVPPLPGCALVLGRVASIAPLVIGGVCALAVVFAADRPAESFASN